MEVCLQEIESYEARVHFSDLLRRVEKGEEFLVTVRGTPVASLTGVKREHLPRVKGVTH
jgi:prevent-host-death family protein